MDIKIIITNSENIDFIHLVELLDNDLNQRYGRLQDQYNNYNKLAGIDVVVILYVDEIPAACGAFKVHALDSIELKRIYVRKEYRRLGYAKLIVHELEQAGKAKGYTYAYLEVGKNQPEAINLYQSMEFFIIENFEPYIGNQNSICMKKKL